MRTRALVTLAATVTVGIAVAAGSQASRWSRSSLSSLSSLSSSSSESSEDVTIVDECGHMPQIERADQFNRLVRDFIGPKGTTHQ